LAVLFVTPRLIGALSGNATEGITFFGAPSINSFEAYKATRDHGLPPETSPRKSDADLRAEYEAVRIDRLAAQRHARRRDDVVIPHRGFRAAHRVPLDLACAVANATRLPPVLED